MIKDDGSEVFIDSKEGPVGRPKAQANDTFYDAVQEWRNGSITAADAIAKAQIPGVTFYRLALAEGLYKPLALDS